jgi:hypothetical protein
MQPACKLLKGSCRHGFKLTALKMVSIESFGPAASKTFATLMAGCAD